MIILYLRLSVSLAHNPREKTISLLAVLIPVWFPFVFIFQIGNSGNISEQYRDKNGRKKCRPTVLATAGNQPDAIPKNRLSEVVWMSSVPPKTPLDKLLFSRCLVSQMDSELLIANQLEHKASQPNSKTEVIQPNQCIVN